MYGCEGDESCLTDVSFSAFYEDLSELLADSLPSLREAYEIELDWRRGDQPGPQMIYEDLFSPHVARQLKDGNEAEIVRAFEFIETLAEHEDVHVQNLAMFAVLEDLYLMERHEVMVLAMPYMAPATRQLFEEIANIWRESDVSIEPEATRDDDAIDATGPTPTLHDHDFNELLLENFPNLREAYERECRSRDDETPGPYLAYGKLFLPYMVQLLQDDAEAETRKAVKFIEMLMANGVRRVQRLALNTLLENLCLGKDKQLRRLAMPHMEPFGRAAINTHKNHNKDWRRWFRVQLRHTEPHPNST